MLDEAQPEVASSCSSLTNGDATADVVGIVRCLAGEFLAEQGERRYSYPGLAGVWQR